MKAVHIRRKSSGGSRGFTIVELVIAIALFALLALIALPNLRMFSQNANLRSASREITTDLFNVKETSIAQSAGSQIVFNQGANSYTMPDGTARTPSTFSPDIQITNVNFAGGPTVSFTPRGTTTAGSLTLQNARGSTAVITVNFTGRTYVQYNMQ